MKKILLIMLSIMFVVLSCKSPSIPIEKSGVFTSAKVVNANSYLSVSFDGKGFKLFYSDKDGQATGKENTVTESDIKGEDPNYTFQTGVIAGSIQFISEKLIKVTVTFNDEATTLKDILCYSKS
ncbi:hypothetical protein [Brachyspira pilosicoli]|uniref:hypothetical protein n=1 Tax=Brachyspira pilosicoli TaxID=52584 RepID=UPI001CA5447D|nr:hypothetical protein [Brachyspira pilosicoli]MBW5396719.1 hypothetical protein [Brachyspira pilosicoli]